MRSEQRWIDFMVTIGRNNNNDIVLTDTSVASEHAHIEAIDGNRLVIRDIGSASGTFVCRNDVWVEVLVTHLGPQDKIRFGNLEMSWQELSSSSATFGFDPSSAGGKRPAGLVLPGRVSEKPIFTNPKRNPVTGAVEERDKES